MKQTAQIDPITSEYILVHTPIGTLAVFARDGAVCKIRLACPEDGEAAPAETAQPVLRQAALEIEEYFTGVRKDFTFLMQAQGTVFQKRVWQALSRIPYGELRTYGEIAAEVDNPRGSRAVGMACNKNPIMIAVPCHRVVGAGGKLTGYAYGTNMKQQLLALEQQEQHE